MYLLNLKNCPIWLALRSDDHSEVLGFHGWTTNIMCNKSYIVSNKRGKREFFFSYSNMDHFFLHNMNLCRYRILQRKYCYVMSYICYHSLFDNPLFHSIGASNLNMVWAITHSFKGVMYSRGDGYILTFMFDYVWVCNLRYIVTVKNEI